MRSHLDVAALAGKGPSSDRRTRCGVQVTPPTSYAISAPAAYCTRKRASSWRQLQSACTPICTAGTAHRPPLPDIGCVRQLVGPELAPGSSKPRVTPSLNTVSCDGRSCTLHSASAPMSTAVPRAIAPSSSFPAARLRLRVSVPDTPRRWVPTCRSNDAGSFPTMSLGPPSAERCWLEDPPRCWLEAPPSCWLEAPPAKKPPRPAVSLGGSVGESKDARLVARLLSRKSSSRRSRWQVHGSMLQVCRC